MRHRERSSKGINEAQYFQTALTLNIPLLLCLLCSSDPLFNNVHVVILLSTLILTTCSESGVERVQEWVERRIDGQDEDNDPCIHIWTDIHQTRLGENAHDDHWHPAGEVSAYDQCHFYGHFDFIVTAGGPSDLASSAFYGNEYASVATKDNQKTKQVDTEKENN